MSRGDELRFGGVFYLVLVGFPMVDSSSPTKVSGYQWRPASYTVTPNLASARAHVTRLKNQGYTAKAVIVNLPHCLELDADLEGQFVAAEGAAIAAGEKAAQIEKRIKAGEVADPKPKRKPRRPNKVELARARNRQASQRATVDPETAMIAWTGLFARDVQ